MNERIWKGSLLLILFFGLSGVGIAATPNDTADLYQFDDRVQQERFWRLTTELRCLVCQNQNIAESNADLAKDIRDELYKLVRGGASDDEVLEFMVSRYGDFVLFRPPLRMTTVLLWTGPFLLGVVGISLLWRLVIGVSRRPDPVDLSDTENDRLKQLLHEYQEGSSS